MWANRFPVRQPVGLACIEHVSPFTILYPVSRKYSSGVAEKRRSARLFSVGGFAGECFDKEHPVLFRITLKEVVLMKEWGKQGRKERRRKDGIHTDGT